MASMNISKLEFDQFTCEQCGAIVQQFTDGYGGYMDVPCAEQTPGAGWAIPNCCLNSREFDETEDFSA